MNFSVNAFQQVLSVLKYVSFDLMQMEHPLALDPQMHSPTI